MKPDSIVHCARSAMNLREDFPGHMDRSSAATAALVLNRPDLLRKLGMTMAEAIANVDADTPANLLHAQRQLASSVQLVEG